jgi:hypothetical protein
VRLAIGDDVTASPVVGDEDPGELLVTDDHLHDRLAIFVIRRPWKGAD